MPSTWGGDGATFGGQIGSLTPPHVHQTDNVVFSVRAKLQQQLGNLGDSTTGVLEKESDGRPWFPEGTTDKLKGVVEKAVEKCTRT